MGIQTHNPPIRRVIYFVTDKDLSGSRGGIDFVVLMALTQEYRLNNYDIISCSVHEITDKSNYRLAGNSKLSGITLVVDVIEERDPE